MAYPSPNPSTIEELAKQYNPVIQGWWNYYGAFYPTAMRKLSLYIDKKLEQWARRKYKPLLRHDRRSAEWLPQMEGRESTVVRPLECHGENGWITGAV